MDTDAVIDVDLGLLEGNSRGAAGIFDTTAAAGHCYFSSIHFQSSFLRVLSDQNAVRRAIGLGHPAAGKLQPGIFSQIISRSAVSSMDQRCCTAAFVIDDSYCFIADDLDCRTVDFDF